MKINKTIFSILGLSTIAFNTLSCSEPIKIGNNLDFNKNYYSLIGEKSYNEFLNNFVDDFFSYHKNDLDNITKDLFEILEGVANEADLDNYDVIMTYFIDFSEYENLEKAKEDFRKNIKVMDFVALWKEGYYDLATDALLASFGFYYED